MKFDSQIEENFYKEFNEKQLKFFTSQRVYDIKAVRPSKPRSPYDISIEIGNTIIAIIEFKSLDFNLIRFDYSRIEKFAAENNVRFVVLSNGENFIITDRIQKIDRVTTDFDGFVAKLQEKNEINVEEFRYRIADLIKEHINNSDFKFLKHQIAELYNEIAKGIVYDEVEQTFSFDSPTQINNIENRIFRLLLKDDKPLNKIYRYTTLNTIYAMLNYNSFRMNCLVGMNDTSEVNYAENYVFDTNQNFANAPWQTVDAYNRRFISSCSLKKDDLTQWRLYADDSKGVCLVLTIDEKELNNKFIIKRISYGQIDGKHPELDLIKQIINNLSKMWNITFKFKTLSTWRHFFKPYDYCVEEEVRILFIYDNDEEDIKKGWFLTSSHNILNPYVEFKLNDDSLPMQLTEIVLGSKCSEKEINQRQFEHYIRDLRKKKKEVEIAGIKTKVDEYNLKKLKVSISEIRNYR